MHLLELWRTDSDYQSNSECRFCFPANKILVKFGWWLILTGFTTKSRLSGASLGQLSFWHCFKCPNADWWLNMLSINHSIKRPAKLLFAIQKLLNEFNSHLAVCINVYDRSYSPRWWLDYSLLLKFCWAIKILHALTKNISEWMEAVVVEPKHQIKKSRLFPANVWSKLVQRDKRFVMSWTAPIQTPRGPRFFFFRPARSKQTVFSYLLYAFSYGYDGVSVRCDEVTWIKNKEEPLWLDHHCIYVQCRRYYVLVRRAACMRGIPLPAKSNE